MAKTFDEKFDDSTFHTFYRITITSENGQRITFNDMDDYTAREIYDLLLQEQDKL